MENTRRLFKRILIANRGEVAVRIARAAADLRISTVAVHPLDDQHSRHVSAADEAVLLPGQGPRAYLDANQLVTLALEHQCDAIHPGYGFLSENAGFASLCRENGLVFIGPSAETLALLGDKTRALKLAEELGIPIVKGLRRECTLEDVQYFLQSLPAGSALMLKAIAGGGGRGMRVVHFANEVPDAFRQCQAEALAAFGRDELYVEQLLPFARHIEVQVLGDGLATAHLGERECSLQRARQKLIELAPSPTLDPATRHAIISSALQLAQSVAFQGLGTFEFLLDASEASGQGHFVFMEANPRLQVEHTVTEEVTGIDLVQVQLLLAQGSTLAELGLTQDALPAPRGYAMQLRINMESMTSAGVLPAAGTLHVFDLPGGPGVRVDTFAYTGYSVNPRYDSLLAKLIVSSPSPDFGQTVARGRRALAECTIAGVDTNVAFLQALLSAPAVTANTVHTRYIDENLGALLGAAAAFKQLPEEHRTPIESQARAGIAPPSCVPLTAPLNGTVVDIMTAVGEQVLPGQELLVIEAMKMQYAVCAGSAAVVAGLDVEVGDLVQKGQELLFVEPGAADEAGQHAPAQPDPDTPRPDLAEVLQRLQLTQDAARVQAVNRRHELGLRTARENIHDLCDAGSFLEYGALTFAAQKARRPVEELIRQTPADGLVAGIGSINSHLVGEQKARCLVLAYDYTVLAGTQGTMNHRKTDRVLTLAKRLRLPVVLFAEGGGGRPGDTDNATKVAGLDVPTFQRYAQLSGLVPRIAIVAGRCFAGNAALAGCSDIIIGVRGSSLGMGGPAMIEGGGLGIYHPDDVGPVDMQSANGVLDLLADDEAVAVNLTRKLLAVFQGSRTSWECADQRLLRLSVPENRRRAYDIRGLINMLADIDSVIELRPQFAPSMITAFIRVEGRALGLIANVPTQDGGAIDSAGSDKAARFMQLCDAFDIPLLSLCDTPGFLVGPQAESTALVRHTSRMFVTAASMDVPVLTIVLRKGYGLGAMAMAAGGFHHTVCTVAWPTGEFGGMGLEGGVRLGFRKELDGEPDTASRQALYERLVAEAYKRGKALSAAASLEIDAVIDPAESRRWISLTLEAAPQAVDRSGRKRPFIDTW